MTKTNAFLARIEAQQRLNVELQRRFTIQHSEDMAVIALNKAFGFGPKRLTQFINAYREVFLEWAVGALEDGKTDRDIEYTKGALDRELQRILGENFRPWEERYPAAIFGSNAPKGGKS